MNIGDMIREAHLAYGNLVIHLRELYPSLLTGGGDDPTGDTIPALTRRAHAAHGELIHELIRRFADQINTAGAPMQTRSHNLGAYPAAPRQDAVVEQPNFPATPTGAAIVEFPGATPQRGRKSRCLWTPAESLRFEQLSFRDMPGRSYEYYSSQFPGKTPVECRNKFFNQQQARREIEYRELRELAARLEYQN
jgi:hypothetical protein